MYDSFHWNCYTSKTHQIEKLRFFDGISWYKFKLRVCFDFNLCRGIWVPGSSGFRGFIIIIIIFSGICHIPLDTQTNRLYVHVDCIFKHCALFLTVRSRSCYTHTHTHTRTPTQNIHTHTCVHVICHCVFWVAKTHRMPLSCKSFFTQEPLIIGLFCGKQPIQTRHPMSLRHPVHAYCIYKYMVRMYTSIRYVYIHWRIWYLYQ